MNKQHLEVGDTVAYSAGFMRSFGIYEARFANMRGVVEKIADLKGSAPRICDVKWDDGMTARILECNLAKPGTARFGDAYA